MDRFEEIVMWAKEILKPGSKLVVESRALVAIFWDLEEDTIEEYPTIIGFESEIEGYPSGDARKDYAAEYLKRLEIMLEENTRSLRPMMEKEAKKLIERYSSTTLE